MALTGPVASCSVLESANSNQQREASVDSSTLNPEHIRMGEIVHQFREARGFSRTRLAQAAACSYDLIAAIERGERNTTAPMRRKVADALEIPLSVFTNERMRRRFLDGLLNGIQRPETAA